MKKILSLLLCALLLCALGGCGRGEVEDKYVKIGLFEPITGDNALYGNYERLGVEYARTVRPSAIINGEAHTVQLLVKDNQSSVVESVYVARELAAENVAVALGCYDSTCCNVAASNFEDANISVIGITATDPNVTSNHPNYYRVCYLDEWQGRALAQYAWEYGARNAYCLAQKDRDYDKLLCQAFIDEFKALGGSVITSVTEVEYNVYTTNLTNFADYIFGCTNSNADILFAPIPYKKGAQLIQECAAANVKFSILGDDSWDVDEIGAAPLETYMYVSCATPFAADRNEECAAFVQGFQDWLKADPRRLEANGGTDAVNSASALAYDAYMVAVSAIELASSTDPAEVSKAIGNVSYDGVTGHIAFDQLGDVAKTEMYIKNADTFYGNLRFEKTQLFRQVAQPVTEEGQK